MSQMTVTLSPHVRAGTTTRMLMRDVVIALLPAGVIGVYRFGLAALLLLVTSVASALLFEALGQRMFGRRVDLSDGSAVVTGLLIAYGLPPSAPFWLAIIGPAVALILVKQLFGGLGHNFVNPALAARGVLLASWPVLMTAWALPGAMDALSSATPLVALRAAAAPSHLQLLLGQCGGSIGEVGRIGIALGAAYLLIRRVITWHIPASYLGFSMLFALLGGGIAGDPLTYLLSGGLLLGACFMATDYVTSPVTPLGRIVFGFGCALINFLIRAYGAYPEGVTYAILLMNVATPLIERMTLPRVYGEVKRRAA